MATIFDLFSVALFLAAISMFLVRWRHEEPPLAPYILIALTSIAAYWIGGSGAGLIAIAFLITGSFLLLHLTSLPYREDREDGTRA